MRLHFQERPWDLYLSLSYGLGLTALLLATNTGNLFGLLLLLFVPGYVFVAALFPRNSDIGWTERIVLSFGVSIAIVPLIGLALTFTQFGIGFGPLTASIGTFTGVFGFAAYVRRTRLPVEDRLSATIVIELPGRANHSRVDKALAIAAVLSIVFALATFGYVVLVPRPGESFTEFYLLGRGGNATGYPTRLNVSQPGTVFVVVANHEDVTVNYTVRVDLVGVRTIYNATLGYNQTTELNRTTWRWFNTSLGDGQTWTQPYTFSIQSRGAWVVQFFLYRNPDAATVYRETHISVQVT